ncbi:MAG: exodeoxyribonuclease VII small subunit [Christensenellales bacterium]
MTIEEKIESLNDLLSKIEDPKIGLEKSVEMYEKACGLIKESYEDLKKCSGKIMEITESLKMINFDENK